MQLRTIRPRRAPLALRRWFPPQSPRPPPAVTTATMARGPGTPRMYNQVQRLGNPLVSEVLLAKRSHPTHGTIGPAGRCGAGWRRILSFITGPGSVAGRRPDYANMLGSVLLPDMLVVQTDKDPATATLAQRGGSSAAR